MPIGYLITVGLVAVGMSLALRPLGRPRTRGVSFIGTPIIVRRSLRARPAVDRALEEGLGRGWDGSIDPKARTASARLPWVRILLAPLPLFRRDVRKYANIAYGGAGRRNRLDLYRHRSRPSGCPILIHLHGGHFRTGRKSFEARPLLHGLASHGWVCISANYRLQPAATFPDYLVDVKKVIAWAREHAREYGGDPPHAPPLLVAHGDQDTFVPPEHARRFVERLRDSGTNPVVYVELPGAQHSFDLFHSIRFETLIDGIESFAAWARAQAFASSDRQASGRERAAS